MKGWRAAEAQSILRKAPISTEDGHLSWISAAVHPKLLSVDVAVPELKA